MHQDATITFLQQGKNSFLPLHIFSKPFDMRWQVHVALDLVSSLEELNSNIVARGSKLNLQPIVDTRGPSISNPQTSDPEVDPNGLVVGIVVTNALWTRYQHELTPDKR